MTEWKSKVPYSFSSQSSIAAQHWRIFLQTGGEGEKQTADCVLCRSRVAVLYSSSVNSVFHSVIYNSVVFPYFYFFFIILPLLFSVLFLSSCLELSHQSYLPVIPSFLFRFLSLFILSIINTVLVLFPLSRHIYPSLSSHLLFHITFPPAFHFLLSSFPFILTIPFKFLPLSPHLHL